MAVDGALVLTAARDIIGFGAEIHVPTQENEIVYRALDIQGDQSVPERADEAGLGIARLTPSLEIIPNAWSR